MLTRTRELIANVRRIEIRTRRTVDALTAGAYHSVFKGRGIEFDEVRGYQPEDDARLIDWNVTARFGHPFIKQFVEERELTVFLVVDISGSGDFGSTDRTKNEQAAELAALLAFSAIRNNDRVGLLLFTSRQELFVPPRKGRRHVLRLVRDLLACERTARGTDIRAGLEALMRLATRRSIVFLISDMLDTGFEEALAVAGRRHDLVALRLTDARELALPRTGWLTVEDAERGDLVRFDGASRQALTQYAESAGRRRSHQDRLFLRAGVDLIDIRCGEDVVRPLMEFFRRREQRR